MFFKDLRSERQLMCVATDRLSLRWYLGYDLTEALPDHSSLTRIPQFDGGVYVIRHDDGSIGAHAGIKNKGIIQEIAVATEPRFQRQGMGQAVVVHAIAAILAQGNVPDTMSTIASYALAEALGFERVVEAVFWEYELSNWRGFAVK
jgi:GNAT superfamily N-acetyltransferase